MKSRMYEAAVWYQQNKSRNGELPQNAPLTATILNLRAISHLWDTASERCLAWFFFCGLLANGISSEMRSWIPSPPLIHTTSP
jgi:hypothetical protein